MLQPNYKSCVSVLVRYCSACSFSCVLYMCRVVLWLLLNAAKVSLIAIFCSIFVYGAVIVAQSHCESALGWYDKYGTAPGGRRPSDKAKRPGLRVRL